MDCILFHVLFKSIWRRHRCQWRNRIIRKWINVGIDHLRYFDNFLHELFFYTIKKNRMLRYVTDNLSFWRKSMEILNQIFHDNLSCCLCKKWWIPFIFVCCLTPWIMVVYQTNEFRNCNYLPYYVIFSPCFAYHHGVILLFGGTCDYSVCIMLGSY